MDVAVSSELQYFMPEGQNGANVKNTMAGRAKKRKFSKVKAVKAIARERVGQPKPERVLPEEPRKKVNRKRKHKPTLQEIIDQMD